MPTRRALVIFGLALALYLIANQTQVGWVYLMANILLGILVAACLYAQGALRQLRGQRTFRPKSQSTPADGLQSGDDGLNPPEIFEDDRLEVRLTFEQTKRRPAFLVGGEERCPFAPPEQQRQSLFLPALFRNQPLTLRYETSAYRRGAHSFPPLTLHSTGPFHLFKMKQKMAVPGELLVYPRYHPLRRLRLLDNRGFADRQALRPGSSAEVIGTREYRSGDSLRQIHWRSTARAGRLVVKEFADQDQLTMTVILDLSQQGQLGEGKFSTFETALRLAASLGYYATQQHIPFRLAGHSEQWQPPAMDLSWWGALHYLARVKNDGAEPLSTFLTRLTALPLAVVLVSNPHEATLPSALAALPGRGIYTLALIISLDGHIPPSLLKLNSETLKIHSIKPSQWVSDLEEL